MISPGPPQLGIKGVSIARGCHRPPDPLEWEELCRDWFSHDLFFLVAILRFDS